VTERNADILQVFFSEQAYRPNGRLANMRKDIERAQSCLLQAGTRLPCNQ
jgi:3-hydroxyisobutyrate dehydrogenase-like beta-hydroxyacid dehydrogenase